MIETIPNAAADKGFQQDARQYVETVMQTRQTANFELDKIEERVKDALYKTYLHALQTGFRAGWRIREQRKGE